MKGSNRQPNKKLRMEKLLTQLSSDSLLAQ